MPLTNPHKLAELGVAAHRFHTGTWSALHPVCMTLLLGKLPPAEQRRAAAAELRAYHTTAILPQTVTPEDLRQCGELAKIIENL